VYDWSLHTMSASLLGQSFGPLHGLKRWNVFLRSSHKDWPRYLLECWRNHYPCCQYVLNAHVCRNKLDRDTPHQGFVPIVHAVHSFSALLQYNSELPVCGSSHYPGVDFLLSESSILCVYCEVDSPKFLLIFFEGCPMTSRIEVY
jgi:hypothetical protein